MEEKLETPIKSKIKVARNHLITKWVMLRSHILNKGSRRLHCVSNFCSHGAAQCPCLLLCVS